jgi:hypothetical protein
MIEELEAPAETHDPAEPPRVRFDLGQMTMGDVELFERWRQGDADAIDLAWLNALLDRVVIGGRAGLSVAQFGYVWSDLGEALRAALSPKVRASARSTPPSDAEAS